ncbi:ead/Ea22-like family protein [Escherichia coli]
MSKIDYQALRELAKQATQGEWVAFISPGKYGTYAVHTPGDNHHGDIVDWPGFDEQKNAENNARYIAAFNPEVVQALLDELERNQQYIKRRDQENEDIALTVGKLRVELEGKDSKIANLTAERDALREGEMGDARHINTRAAADIYFQLVEECEIPAGGSLVEYVDDMREKLEAAEKRNAKLQSENAYIRNRYKELDLLIGKNILVMQAAIIEWQSTGDAKSGLAWIYNTLFGPGELPDESEKDAQAYFNRKYAPIDEKLMELHKWFWEQSEAERAAGIRIKGE